MKLKLLARFGLLLPLLSICGGGIQDLTQAEKNAFLSRKKWYVTAEFFVNGNGASGEHQYAIDSSSRVRLELNHAIPGQWPMSSPPDPSQPIPTGRFISWMAMPTEAANAAMERGETNPALLPNFYYKMSADVNARFSGPAGNGTGIDTYRGSGDGYAVGNCMLSLDLKEGVFDLVFQVGGAIWPKVTHAWDYPDPPEGRGDGSEEHEGQSYKAWMDSMAGVSLSHRIIRSDLKQDGSIQFTIRTNSPVTVPVGRPTAAYSAIFRISPNPPTTAKLILEPEQSYASWRPKPGNSETEEGEYLNVKWKVEEPGLPAGQKPKVNRVTFRLGNVSSYPGVCMNWPVSATTPPGGQLPKPKFDLAFPNPHPEDLDRTVRESNQVLIIDGNSAKAAFGGININCYDGAAIGELVAEAEMVDGRIIQCEVVGQTGRNKVLIPDREEGVSDIARDWRSRRAAGLADGSDDESIPVGDARAPGDGLSVWEEYRGFFQGGTWKDNCLPERKDLFIVNKVGAGAQDGIDFFVEVTQLVVHEKLLREEAPDLIVNFNNRSDRHVVDQHCLLLKPHFQTSGGLCMWMPGRPFPGPPKNTASVRVALTNLPDRVGPVTSSTRTVGPATTWVVAHELCHGLGVYHHGDGDLRYVTWFRASGVVIPGRQAPVERVFEGSNGGPMVEVLRANPLSPYPNDELFGLGNNQIVVWVGKRSGEHSGDGDCIMRYELANVYEAPGSPLVRVTNYSDELPGTKLCTSPAGTMFNYPTHQPHSRYGGAGVNRGNCAHQFVVSDKFEKQNR